MELVALFLAAMALERSFESGESGERS